MNVSATGIYTSEANVESSPEHGKANRQWDRLILFTFPRA